MCDCFPSACHAGFKLALKVEIVPRPIGDSLDYSCEGEEEEEEEEKGSKRERMKNKERFEYWMFLEELGDVEKRLLPAFLVEGRTLGNRMVEDEEEEGYDEDYGEWSVAASTRSFVTTMKSVKGALREVEKRRKKRKGKVKLVTSGANTPQRSCDTEVAQKRESLS